ncbi:hypothetical protein B0S90_1400 [Caldicellulosiruptor bescii]|uniref:Uncharacterized protein n=3 Tax=Caldicellulosiruptor TaxID=44000 RepID=B9MRA3_CALBD|nr:MULTISPECIES: plantaricin C family lantibiotic [Caldicellulosiruptor]ACM60207.1 hypothetical protein Athe_1106 [Caldicellulosiruptor bescii DSM 6725]PBC87622.1 hypothetical protein B0S87_0540 [Caldicellulosiruptor bescii]PBC90555.1 hypothetical protein B0S89_0902 [Caldicellulosiruptor bescii]PBD04013.1 hypothetical protein B0S85_1639 [Caldicellulosiruptor bescii]PBD06352.1 hypothetical protein B0S90_1400 [Caldicellulosiruptor bescii]
MKESTIIKNPVLRNKVNAKIYNPAGDIVKEIQEQNLPEQAGGGTPTVVVGVISAVTAVTNLAFSIDQAITKYYACSLVYTYSAECRSDGRSCRMR